MDVQVFLSAQTWLLPVGASVSTTSRSSKRLRPSPLHCKTRFHVCLEEQRTLTHETPSTSAWRGLLAGNIANIRLHLPQGNSKATFDGSFTVCEADADTAENPHAVVMIEWYNQQYYIDPQQLVKVVCSPGVAAAAGARHGGGCLLSAPAVDAQQQYAGVEWACLVTKHVCLDLMVPADAEVVSHLGRLVSALHTAAGLCTAAAVPEDPEGNVTRPDVAETCTTPGGTTPTADASSDRSTFLPAASCEAQLLRLLLSGLHTAPQGTLTSFQDTLCASPASRAQQQQEQHLLNAVGHLHASQRSG